MGAGIAQVNAQNGYQVTVVDTDEFSQKCMVQIAKSLDIISKKKFPNEIKSARNWSDDVFKNIKTTQSLSEGCRNADLVIESVIEDLDIKKQTFLKMDQLISDHCILASNTSSLSIEEISAGIKSLDRVVGLHFFNPVWRMRLLEVIGVQSTSQKTLDIILPYAESIGKVAVHCKDNPGFIVNSLVYPYLMEALRFYEQGHASIEDIDTAMKLGAGLPKGPFELMDLIGLDVVHQVIGNWNLAYPDDPRYTPSKVLDEMVKMKKLGMKTRQGFYTYKHVLY